jgi:hypothetical protein
MDYLTHHSKKFETEQVAIEAAEAIVEERMEAEEVLG